MLGQIDQYFRNIVHWLSPGVGLLYFAALVGELALAKQVTEVLDDDRVSAPDVGRHVWEVAIRRDPPCLMIQLNRAVLDDIRLKPVPFGPWDWPYPGPDDGPWPPIPPVEAAQAMLGGDPRRARDGSEAPLADGAVERLTAVGLRGARDAVANKVRATRLALQELERTAALFEGDLRPKRSHRPRSMSPAPSTRSPAP